MRTKVIDVSGLGTVRIRRLTGDDVSREREATWYDVATASRDVPYIVCRALVNDAGERLFTDDDQADVAESMPFDAMIAIVSAVLQLSGMGTKPGFTAPPAAPAPAASTTTRPTRPAVRRDSRQRRATRGATETRRR